MPVQTGTDAADTIFGGTADDTLSGLGGNDALAGFDGADSISGGEGGDLLRGLDGSDTIDGGAGADTLEGGTGSDRLEGGAGLDTLAFQSLQRGVTIDLRLTTPQVVNEEEGADLISGIENVVGGQHGDRLTGDAQANILDGGQGSDTLDGGGGSDTLQGITERDVASGGDGDDRFVVNSANATLSGGQGSDVFFVYGFHADGPMSSITDWSAADRLEFTYPGRTYGEATAANAAEAYTVASQMGRSGSDYVAVQVGADVIVFGTPNQGRLALTDAIRLVGKTLDDISAANFGLASANPSVVAPTLPAAPTRNGPYSADGTITGNTQTAHLADLIGARVTSASSTLFAADGAVADLQLFGSQISYNGIGGIDGGTVSRVVFATTANGGVSLDLTMRSQSAAPFGDWLVNDATAQALSTLLSGADRVSGGQGADLINAGFGNDLLYGAGGSDTLFGGLGNDVIYAGSPTGAAPVGSTYLRGEDGDDWIQGGAGFDDIHGNMGMDTETGGDGDDWVVGGQGHDLLFGDAGSDLVYGNLGQDTCVGGDGNDIVRGGQDNDVLFAGAGDDYVSGDKGDDTVTGGSGADLFHTFGDAGLDRVLDFNLAEGDRVLLDPGTQYTVAQTGADTVITMTGGGRMILVGIQLSSLTQGWIFGA